MRAPPRGPSAHFSKAPPSIGIRAPAPFAPQDESAYLNCFARGDARRLMAGCCITAIVGVLMVWSDYRFSDNPRVFAALVMLRLAMVAVMAGIVRTLRTPALTPDGLHRAAWVFALTLCVSYSLILLSRPSDYHGHIPMDITSVLLAPFILPENPRVRFFFPALLAALCLAIVIFARLALPPQEVLAVAVSLAVAVTAGWMLGNLAYTYRRRAWIRERQLEDLLAQQKGWIGARDRLLRTMAHEVRTPLNVVTSGVSLLGKHAQQLNNHQRAEISTRIETAIKRMTALIDRSILLEQRSPPIGTDSGFPAGYLDKSEVDLGRWFHDLVDGLNTSTLHGRHIEVQVSLTAPGAIALEALQSITENLLSNAAKYSPPDSPIVVRFVTDPHGITLLVTDFGDGIPEHESAYIFEPFFRGDSAARRPESPGLGLGLAIVKETLDALGGQISVHRPLPRGTTMQATIPWENAA